MKQKQSKHNDLRRLIHGSIPIREIAEPLASFDGSTGVDSVRAFMESRSFDVVGVRRNGQVVGFAHRQALQNGQLDRYTTRIEAGQAVHHDESLAQAFKRLRSQTAVFVEVFGLVACEHRAEGSLGSR